MKTVIKQKDKALEWERKARLDLELRFLVNNEEEIRKRKDEIKEICLRIRELDEKI